MSKPMEKVAARRAGLAAEFSSARGAILAAHFSSARGVALVAHFSSVHGAGGLGGVFFIGEGRP